VSEFIVRPIGVVHSEFKERAEVPRLGGPATLEVFPEYAAGLLRLEKHSHLWVLAWLHEADRDLLQVIPRGIEDRSPEHLHGVFAVRSPARPNPLSLTLVEILKIEGRFLRVSPLDLVDGTPIVDLKPYFVSRDAVYAARNEQIGRPAHRDALRESLQMQARNFHGELCAEACLAAELFTHFRSDLLQMEEPRDLVVTLPLERAHMVDAFVGMARVSPGRGTLRFGSSRQVRLACDRGVALYRLAEEGFEFLCFEPHS